MNKDENYNRDREVIINYPYQSQDIFNTDKYHKKEVEINGKTYIILREKVIKE